MGLAVEANVLAVLDVNARWLSPICGLVLAVALPSRLISRQLVGHVEGPGTRWACSVALDVLLLMVAGFVMNEVLPLLGVGHPLGRTPVYGLLNLIVLGLIIAMPASVTRMPTTVRLRTAERVVLMATAVCLGLTVVGAVRLNNNAGGGVALVAMGLSALLALVLLVLSDRLGRATVALALWGVSLSFLWATSLRGWYVTGHDIQLEFQVFSYTTQHGEWLLHASNNSYSACLSITILPQLLLEATHVFAPLIFKVDVPMLFAFCPVVLFETVRRILGPRLGIAGAVLFISFPTYTNDMVFLDRQEVAFLFVAVAIALMTSGGRYLKHKQTLVLALLTGMVVAHYSTAYVFVAAAIGGYLLTGVSHWIGARVVLYRAKHVGLLPPGPGGEWGSARPDRMAVVVPAQVAKALDGALVRQRRRKPALGLGSLSILLAIVLGWSVLASQAEPGQFSSLLSSTAEGFIGQSAGSRSSDVNYSVVPQGAATPDEQLKNYETTIREQYPDPQADGYYSASLVGQYPIQGAAQAVVPVSALGRTLSKLGVDPYRLNNFMHGALARAFQILAFIGLLAALIGWRRSGRVTPEHVFWAASSLLVLAADVVMPSLSVNYGLLRLFQQSLLVLSPIIIVGSLALFGRLGPVWSSRVTCGLSLVFLFALTGIMPQLTGGFTPTLNLNNSGEYYENYYTQSQELSAASWLNANAPKSVPIQVNPFLASRVQVYIDARLDQNDFPTLLYRNSFVMLGADTARTGVDTAAPYNDLVDYRYPLTLLERQKDLVYSAGGAIIFHSSQ